jgi:phospholipase C
MRRTPYGKPLTIAALALFVFGGCRGAGAPGSSSMLPAAGMRPSQASVEPPAAKKIKHVVIIIQENRSFNNLFYGYPGAKTQSWGVNSKNKKVTLQPITLATGWDMQHNGQAFITSCNGTGKVQGTHCRMNGFDKLKCSPKVAPCPKKSKYLAYSYVPHTETKAYFDMAHQYVLADEMYASDFDISSFVSHQYIVAGVNPKSSVDYPSNGGDWGCTGGPTDQIPILHKDRIWLNKGIPISTERPCWNPKTLADELDAKKLPWSFYAVAVGSIAPKYACGRGGDHGLDGNGARAPGLWSAYQAIDHICYSPDWNNDVAPFSPPAKFLTDIKGGELRAVTWITPTDKDSDHGGVESEDGPSWVASLVNAIGESKFWDSTAIFIFWDDPGGWYDPEPPQYLKDSNYDGLGYRIPLLMISPYAKKGLVDHTHYEHCTILRFVEETFGLSRLDNPYDCDARAALPTAAFDFSQPPRKFVHIKVPLDERHFVNEPLDGLPPDDD